MSEEAKRIAREIVDRLCADTDEPCPGGACCASFNCECPEELTARALDAARAEGRAESLAEALSTIRSHVGMDWDRFKGGDIAEFIATKVEGEAAQFAAIRTRGNK